MTRSLKSPSHPKPAADQAGPSQEHLGDHPQASHTHYHGLYHVPSKIILAPINRMRPMGGAMQSPPANMCTRPLRIHSNAEGHFSQTSCNRPHMPIRIKPAHPLIPGNQPKRAVATCMISVFLSATMLPYRCHSAISRTTTLPNPSPCAIANN